MTDGLRAENGIWNKAWLTKNAAAVERIAADDYLYIGPQGQMLRKSAILNIIRSRSYRLARGKWTDVSISPLGTNAALVVDRFTGAGEYRGRSFREDHRHTTIWVRRNREWQVRLEHCSAIARTWRKPQGPVQKRR